MSRTLIPLAELKPDMRVYVGELDVFGKTAWKIAPTGTFMIVKCEFPLLGYDHTLTLYSRVYRDDLVDQENPQ